MRDSEILAETVIQIEHDKFKRPIAIMPPEIPPGSYKLIAIKKETLIIILTRIKM